MYTLTLSAGRHVRHIDDEVPNMSPEIVLVLIPADSIWKIWIRIKQTNTVEVRSPLDGRQIVRITDTLSVVRHDDGCGDQVSTRWEVNNGWGCRLRRAIVVVRTSVPVESGIVQRIRIVRNTVTYAGQSDPVKRPAISIPIAP